MDSYGDGGDRKMHGLRAAAVSSSSALHQSLSPLVQLLPTGYRDVQPFQKGRAWHTNGKHVSSFRRSKDEKVVFPVIPTQKIPTAAPGEAHALEYDDDKDDRDEGAHEPEPGSRLPLEEPSRVSSPSASAIPTPPSAPRRPLRGDSNQAAASGSFRSRAISASGSSISNSVPVAPTIDVESAALSDPPASPEQLMSRLWHEYAERLNPSHRPVDKNKYHRKMQHKYNELKQFREQIAQLERELAETRQERDDVRELASRQAIANQRRQEIEGEESESGKQQPSAEAENGSPVGLRHTTQQQPSKGSMMDPEESSYREKSFRLERSLGEMKESMNQLQAKFAGQQQQDRLLIESLEAKLKLEQEAREFVVLQLRETKMAFKVISDELIVAQTELERERIHKQIVLEQVHAETQKLITDHRRSELQSRVQSVVRTLGKEALRHKLEALHTRVLTAEHHMRIAQLEAERLARELGAQKQQMEAILSSSALKYHTLADDGGIPGILARSTQLFIGTRQVNGQYLLVQILFEDNRLQRKSAADEDDLFIHYIVYEAWTAQDDHLTLHLRDIKRLVPDYEKYTAMYASRKLERFQELAELLFLQLHVGYKNGHIVLAEIPTPSNKSEQDQKRELTIYHGTRYIQQSDTEVADTATASKLLVDVVVNEVYAPATSELWWLEIHAAVLECPELDDSAEATVRVDTHQLNALCPHLGCYRPGESIHNQAPGTSEDQLLGIHEELLEPLLEKLQLNVRSSGDHEAMSLIVNYKPLALASSDESSRMDPVDNETTDTHHHASESAQEMSVSRSLSGLDYRCIASIDCVFYSVRIQEVWDGELMLEIEMADPESLHHFHRTLSEAELVRIARHLLDAKVVQEDHADHIKYGLDPQLYDPMCRFIKKHSKPILPIDCEVMAAAPRYGIAIGLLGDQAALCLTEPSSDSELIANRGVLLRNVSLDLPAARQRRKWTGVQVLITGELPMATVERVFLRMRDGIGYPSATRRHCGLQWRAGKRVYSLLRICEDIMDATALHVFPLNEADHVNTEQSELLVVASNTIPVAQILDALGIVVL